MLFKFLITTFAINILLLLLTNGLARRIQAERITVVTPEATVLNYNNNADLTLNSSLLPTADRLENSSYLLSKENDFIEDKHPANASYFPEPSAKTHLDTKPPASTHSYINFDVNYDDAEEKNFAQTESTRQATIKEVLTNLFPKGFSDIFRFSYNPEPPEETTVFYTSSTTAKTITTTAESSPKTEVPLEPLAQDNPVQAAELNPTNVTIFTSITRETRRELKPGHIEIVIEKIVPNQSLQSSEEFKDGSNYISKDDLLRINRAAVDSPVLPSLLLSPLSSNQSSREMNSTLKAAPIVILNSHSPDDFEDVVEDDNQLAESQRVMHQVQPPESLHYHTSAHHDINIHVIHDDSQTRGQSKSLDRKQKPFFTPAVELKDDDEEPIGPENRTKTTYSQIFNDANKGKGPEVTHIAPSRKALRLFKPIYHRSKPTVITKGRFHYEHLKRPTANLEVETTTKLSNIERYTDGHQFQESKSTNQEYESEINSDSSEIDSRKSRGKQRFYNNYNADEEAPSRQIVDEALLGPLKYEKTYTDEDSPQNTENPSSSNANESQDAENPQYEQRNEAELQVAEQPEQQQNPVQENPRDNYETQNDVNAYVQIIPTTSSYQQQPSIETRDNPQSLFQFATGLANKNNFGYGSPNDPYAFIQVIPPQPQFSHPNPTVTTNIGYLQPSDYTNNRDLYNTVNGEKDQQSVTPISLIFVTINSPLSTSRDGFPTSSPADLKQQNNEKNEEQSEKTVNDDNQTDSSNKSNSKPNAYTFVEVQKSINIHNKLITEKDGRIVESHETIYPQEKATEKPPSPSSKEEGEIKDYGSLTKNPIRVADSEVEESKKVFESAASLKEEQHVPLPSQEITEVEPIQQAQVIHEAHTIQEVSKGKEGEALASNEFADGYQETPKISEPQNTQQYSHSTLGSVPYIQGVPQDLQRGQYEEYYKGFASPSSQGIENSYISQNIQETASEDHNEDLYRQEATDQEESGQSGFSYADNIRHHQETTVYQDGNQDSQKFDGTNSQGPTSQVLPNTPHTQAFPDNSLQTLEYNNHEEVFNHPLPLRVPYALASPQAPENFPQHMPAPYSLLNPLGVPLTVEQSNDRPYPIESIRETPYPVENVVERDVPLDMQSLEEKPIEKLIEKYVNHPVAVPVKIPVALPLPSTVNPLLHYHNGLTVLNHPNAVSLPYGSVITSPTLARIPFNLMNTYYNNVLRKLGPDVQSSFKSFPPFGRAKTLYRFAGPKAVFGNNLGIKLDLKPPPRQLPKTGFDPNWDKGARYTYNYNTLPWDLDVSSSQAVTQQIEHLSSGVKENFEEYLRWRNGQLLKRSPTFSQNLHMEYGFKPPLVPSLEIDEKGVPLKAIDDQTKEK
uniref:Uncharacterized protein n=1 Tax=Glossina brevipalpis TaxID=37001 RepID=A0A1A9WIV5_9MUSC